MARRIAAACRFPAPATLTEDHHGEAGIAMAARRTGSARPHDEAERPAAAPVMTINEAAEAFPGEWIFMQVTDMDEREDPLAGIVLAHHRTRDGIQPAIMDVIKNPPQDARGFYTYNGPRFRTNEEWRAYLQRQRDAHDAGA